MQQFTKIIIIAGMTFFIGTLWYASAHGFGIASLTDQQTLTDKTTCPDHQKDRFGNCPPRTHRRTMGGRNYFGGGGK